MRIIKPDDTTVQRCRICKLWLDKHDYFSEGMKEASLAKATCRLCCRELYLKRKADPAKKDHDIARIREWQKINPENCRQAVKKYYETHKDKVLARHRRPEAVQKKKLYDAERWRKLNGRQTAS